MSDRRYLALVVLCVSGLLGFRVAYVEFPTWQVAVETAQVVAGLVKYPAGNPFYIYHTKLWTVVHQIAAVMLRAGLSEIVLSKLISGLLGMVSFQALSMLVYALSADVLMGIGTPFLIFYTRAAEHGSAYPISLLGIEHTYGILSLSLVVLVVALLGAGCYRLGGFLLGLAPAVHLSWGAWLWLIVACAFLWDFNRLRKECRSGLNYFIAGCVVTLSSVLVQRIFTYDVPTVDPQTTSRYLAGFITAWDSHRQPAELVTVGSILNFDVLVLASIWLIAFARDLPRASVLAVRALAISGALSLLFMFISWLPPERVPALVEILIPSRYLNFDTFAFVPLLVGLLGVYRRRFLSGVVAAALFGGLFFSYRSMLWDGYQGDSRLVQAIQFNPWHVFVTMSAAALLVAVVSRWSVSRDAPAVSPGRSPAATIAWLASLGFVAASAVLTWRLYAPAAFTDRTNDPLFAAAAADQHGMLLTAGTFHLVQLRTRRPVLFDGGGVDELNYAAEGGPEMERILREVYGIDFFKPAPESAGSGINGFTKPIWEGYSRDKWMRIARDFGVSQVMTPADWTLDLPMAIEHEGLRLYRIAD
jgi:hypothetical protein